MHKGMLADSVRCFYGLIAFCFMYRKSPNKRRVSIKRRVPNKRCVTGGYDGMLYGISELTVNRHLVASKQQTCFEIRYFV